MSKRSPQHDGIDEAYWRLSTQPLQSLFFLLPLIIAYEAALPFWGAANSANQASDIYARQLINDLFRVLGVGSTHLPMLIIVVVLVSMHVVSRHRWRFEPRLYLWMWVESLALALPLFVFALVFFSRVPGTAEATEVSTAMQLAAGARAVEHTWQAEMLFSIGAGLYEELFFRLAGITLLHMLFHDYMKLKEWPANVAVVGIAAVAFSLYHFVKTDPFVLAGLNMRDFVFLTVAGVYFGFLFLTRGFGIVAATHAIYDIMVVLRMMRE